MNCVYLHLQVYFVFDLTPICTALDRLQCFESLADAADSNNPGRTANQMQSTSSGSRNMALSRGLRCCQRVFSWIPVLIIAAVVLWSYYAYVFALCLCEYDTIVFIDTRNLPLTASSQMSQTVAQSAVLTK